VVFLRNSWYVAAWNHELIDGRKLARTILERPIVLYRVASGKVVALDDRCCHRATPLSMAAEDNDDAGFEESRHRRLLLPLPSQHEGRAQDRAVDPR
jgi:phenylpropionate dioxygenase-like ring-hydroxylating dioxygenase large terminal subunit